MRLAFLFLFLCCSLAVAAPPKVSAPVRVITPASEVSFDFDVIPVADLLRVMYVQAMPEQSYTLDPTVLQDQRPVSFRYRPQDGQFRQVLSAFLRGLGYELTTRGKLDVIRPLPPEVKLSAVEDPSQEVFVYRPRFVDGAQLVEMVSSLFSGRFSTQRRMNIESPKTPSGSVSSPASASQVAAPSGSRFKVLSSPSLRVSSGQTASLTVGQDVPVLGAVTYPTVGGAPVQSVDYRSSGVLFSISPVVRDSSITVQVDQQVSSFVNTTTGVNNSPTLTKRQLSTNVSLQDGDVVVIGGLREQKSSHAASRAPILASIFGSKSADNSYSEILLFLQLNRLDSVKL